MEKKIVSFFGVFLFSLLATTQKTAFTENTLAPTKKKQNLAGLAQPIQLGISLIWEGEHLFDFNLKALSAFRKEFKDVSIFHFLSPAYFTRALQERNHATEKISSLIRPGDSIGLYLQPWRSITRGAGVIFRSTPTFWGKALMVCKEDCGQEVPLEAYSPNEIQKLVRFGKQVIEDRGFGVPRIFMAGGWLASQDVLEALSQSYFLYDFSAISPGLMQRRLGNYPLYKWIASRWPYITPHTQPHPLKTMVNHITEVSLSGGVVDFNTPEEIIQVYQEYANKLLVYPKRSLVLNIGMHQETAEQFLPRLKIVLESIYRNSKKNGIVVKPLVLPGPSLALR